MKKALQRAEDAALEEAFEAGALPEDDRRDPSPTARERALALLDMIEQETGYTQKTLLGALRAELGAI